MKQQNKKRRRRSKASINDGVCNSEAAPSNDEDVLRRILEPFPCVSVEEAASAYKEANGDLNKAVEILGRLVESREDRSTTSSSVSSWNAGSSSCLSTPEEVFGEDHKAQCGVRQKSKMKKAVASAGTVSTVLGKDYVSSTPKKNSSRLKGFNVESYSSKEDMEQFLCSMLGEESQLSFSVVRDVLCQCGYDADKALNILLELSASSVEQTYTGEEALLFPESNDNISAAQPPALCLCLIPNPATAPHCFSHRQSPGAPAPPATGPPPLRQHCGPAPASKDRSYRPLLACHRQPLTVSLAPGLSHHQPPESV